MAEQVATSPKTYTRLRENITRYFNVEELRTLCSDLGVDYDELGGEGKTGKARELIAHLDHRGGIGALVERCTQLRPEAHFEEVAYVPPAGAPDEIYRFSPPLGRLCERITDAKPFQRGLTNWQFLEQIAVRAVIAGGVSAMVYYRQPLPGPIELAMEGKEKNPVTEADLQATAMILETMNTYLSPIIQPSQLDCMLSYLGEETKFTDWFEENIKSNIPQRVLPLQAFFSSYCEHNRLRVIVDGIDGTGGFTRGLPLFCSAVAIIVEDEARVAAIYDPIHHVVYSALLLGPHGRAEEKTEAWAWQVATGNRTDLVELAEKRGRDSEKGLKKEAIGVHLTRSNSEKLHEFLRTYPESPQSILERLARASGAIYALNSGLLAMANVAIGALGGFVNNVTNLWDVAAGEVLVRACRGKVTHFDGSPIRYSSVYQPPVVASNRYLHPRILDILNE